VRKHITHTKLARP